jgi:hypothetical protein
VKEGDTFNLYGLDGRVCHVATVIRLVTLRGISGFAIHEYEGEFRVSHIETGAFLARGESDGAAFVHARKRDKDWIVNSIEKTKRELARLQDLRKFNTQEQD